MGRIEWQESYNTTIDEVDAQHRQLVEYLNQLDEVRQTGDSRGIDEVMAGIVDYTLSHFAFEEAMMEEAGYTYVKAHRSVHQLFIKRVEKYQGRRQAGEDILEEFYDLLRRWLIQHIQRDDAAYVRVVKANLGDTQPVPAMGSQEEGPGKNWFARAVTKFFPV
jgi:hemerythrin